MDADAAALLAALTNLDRVTDDAQADAVALTTALMNDDLLAVAQVTLTMDTAERLAACMSLATMLSRCCTALGITPADLIRKAET